LEHKTSGNKIITSFSYTHDKVGNRLTRTEPDNKINYAYDAIYRLLKAQPNRHDSTSEAYGYDAVGNRLTGPSKNDDYTYGPGNQLLTALGLAYNYDNNGNMTRKGQNRLGNNDKGEHHDSDYAKGNEHYASNEWTYAYDFENRLVKAEKNHTIVTFKYDSFGRRIEKRVKEGENCRNEDVFVHTYVYDGQTIIMEYETTGDGRHKNAEATKYVHGPGIDEPLAMTRDNEVYFFHADGLGSVVALTDKRQHVVETYEYDSFGNLKQDFNQPMQLFTYTGRIFDIETGLLDYRARTYDQTLGRFHQKDPIGFKGGDINLYGYVQNNPVNLTDPTGLAPWNGNFGGDFTPQDNVCSSPADGLNSNKCYKKCCKEHDDCYTKYMCNQTSWLGNLLGILPVAPLLTNAACQICNIKAAACILNNVGSENCCE
jgi:RHS repeat-associated protein